LRIAGQTEYRQTLLIEMRHVRTTVRVMTRFICFCAALLMIFAGVAFGEGDYQRTKDGKIMVWNDDPKPGDVADWFGDRDKDGYATGVGTLTWYGGDGAVYARYHGNMVRGKFNGAVNAHSKGKTGHAIFVDGKRTSGWVAGRAPSLRAIEAPKKEITENAQPVSAEDFGVVSAHLSRRSASEGGTPTVSGATTEARRPTPTPENGDLAKQENAQHPIPETKDTPAEGPSKEKKPATANPSGGGSEVKGQTTAGTVSKPNSRNERAADRNRPTTIQDKPELGDFAGPPSALRTDTVVEAPSTGAEPEIVSTPSANAKLTPQEAMTLADAEARGQGYDLNEYQRPKADYSAVKGKWSLIYDLKEADGGGENAPHFSVTVDDETKKVEVKQ
jgi:hypothetical protein